MTAILQRKLTGARDGAANGRLPLARILRGALARSADKCCGLALMVTGFEQAHFTGDDLEGVLSEPAMLVVLDGAPGRIGAALVSGEVVTALVQRQTMGKVTDGEVADRRFTATDAALAAPLIESTLRMAVDMLEDGADRDCLVGYSFGALADDARGLLLALTATRFRLLTLSVSVVGTALIGRVRFLLPEEDRLPRKAPVSDGTAPAVPSPNAEAMMTVPAELNAVLARIRMPLDELAKLGPGDLIPITRQGMDDTSIVAVTGRTVARAKLGQMNGFRAVRLVQVQGPAMVRAQTRAVEFTPAVISRNRMPEPPEDHFDPSDMSAEEMVAEISDLAGLSADDEEDESDISGRPV